jgi:hypothetical protein
MKIPLDVTGVFFAGCIDMGNEILVEVYIAFAFEAGKAYILVKTFADRFGILPEAMLGTQELPKDGQFRCPHLPLPVQADDEYRRQQKRDKEWNGSHAGIVLVWAVARFNIWRLKVVYFFKYPGSGNTTKWYCLNA